VSLERTGVGTGPRLGLSALLELLLTCRQLRSQRILHGKRHHTGGEWVIRQESSNPETRPPWPHLVFGEEVQLTSQLVGLLHELVLQPTREHHEVVGGLHLGHRHPRRILAAVRYTWSDGR
jgi:hypothetical protein